MSSVSMMILQACFLLDGMTGFFWRDDLKVIIVSMSEILVWLLTQRPLSLVGENALKQGRGRDLKGDRVDGRHHQSLQQPTQ